MTSENVICDCGNEIPVDKSDEWWFAAVACNECDAEITAVAPDGTLTWTSARELGMARAEMARQQFSADANEWFGRGNHCF